MNTSAKIYQDEEIAQDQPVKGVVITSTKTTTTTAPAHPSEEIKLGQKCCGCCCDFRRAVIICNIILFVLTVIGLILLGTSGTSTTAGGSPEYDSDAWGTYVLIQIIMGIITAIMNLLAIAGAVQYNAIMVLVPTVWLVVNFIVAIVTLKIYCSDCVNPLGIIINVVIVCLWIYPHAGFIKEVMDGTMSAETYPREEFSCCCV